jgi:hypothetical protein
LRSRPCAEIYLALTLWAAFSLILCRVGPAESASLGLAWNPSADPMVAGYMIHYGGQSRHYTKTVRVKGRLTSSAVIDNLEEGKAYYFVVTAYNAKGQESTYSPEISNINDGPDTSSTASPNTSPNAAEKLSGKARSQNKIPPSRKVAKTPEGKIKSSRQPLPAHRD